MKMRVARNGFVIFAAVVGSLLATTQSAVGQTVPFYADGFGAYTPADGTFVAPGVGTRLGRYVTLGGVVVTPTDNPLVSTFESTADGNVGIATGASSGDTLLTRFENGVVTLTPTGNSDEFTAIWEADAVVLGGTGDLENAKPTRKPLRVVAINAPFKLTDATWNFKWTLEGNINLGPRKGRFTTPLKIFGGGFVPVLPASPSPEVWQTFGIATQLGRYTSPSLNSSDANTVQIDLDEEFLSDYPVGEELLIPFSGSSTFIAANRRKLAIFFECFIEILPVEGTIRWVADFTPVVEDSTGKFRRVESGSIVMLAFSPFRMSNVPFIWFGDGDLVYGRRN